MKDEYKYTFSILVTCLSLDQRKKRFVVHFSMPYEEQECG